MVGRRLIFHFYAVKGFEDNPAYKMHFACLRKYSHVFDSAKFIISVDDVKDRELISQVASKIAACGFVENTEFVVRENGIYREAETFKREIADNLDNLSGLTFFAHTKGVSNVVSRPEITHSILRWIFGCYYLSLTFLHDVHAQMQMYQHFCQRFFYGPFLRSIPQNNNGAPKYGAEYEGAFFWINCFALSDYLKENGKEIPRDFGRFYAERFPGEMFPIGERIGSYQYRYYEGEGLYENSDAIIEIIFTNEKDLEDFNNEYSKLIAENGI